MAHPFLSGDSENIWIDKWRAHEAEKNFVAHNYGTSNSKPGDSAKQKTTSSCSSTHIKGGSASSLIKEIEQARQQIQNSLKSDLGVTHAAGDGVLHARIGKLESENKRLSGVVDDLRLVVKNLENRIIALESSRNAAPASKLQVDNKKIEESKKEEEDDDDDIDLFGSDDDEDEEDEEAQKIREERLKQYAEKKSKKPTLIAKSNIILDVKPWDDETDMGVLEAEVRKITMDGLLWGASKLVPVGYGIKKLQISCVVEDDKVSTDDLEDQIVAIEDYVQSMDIAAFNKV